MMPKYLCHRSENVDIIHIRVVFSEARAHRIFFFLSFFTIHQANLRSRQSESCSFGEKGLYLIFYLHLLYPLEMCKGSLENKRHGFNVTASKLHLSTHAGGCSLLYVRYDYL